MDRRKFIKSTGALAIVPLIPFGVISPSPVAVAVTRAVKTNAFTSAELSLSIDELSRRYIEPAAKILARGIEQDMLG